MEEASEWKADNAFALNPLQTDFGKVTCRVKLSNRFVVRVKALSQFVLALEVAAFDGDAASRYDDIRASLAKRGTPIGPLDTLIGALELDLILVTHNMREFSRIESLRLVDCVD